MSPLEKEHANDIKIAVLQTTNTHIHETLDRIEKRFDKLDSKIDDKFSKLDSRIWQVMLWTMAGFAGTLGLIAHAFKWI